MSSHTRLEAGCEGIICISVQIVASHFAGAGISGPTNVNAYARRKDRRMPVAEIVPPVRFPHLPVWVAGAKQACADHHPMISS